MRIPFLRAVLALSALALVGCNETLEDIAPKAEKSLPPKLVRVMQAKDMATRSPIMLRIFKEEAQLEVWKQKGNGRYDLVTTYDICKYSGKLGPKFTEGDRQAPEGFYTVSSAQMNPKSSYHLAFNMGFPNAYDRVNGRTGAHLMVHGACSSSGCYSMNDREMEEIYAFAREAFRGGQTAFQVQAFPFRMTAENMARYKNDPNFAFWEMLKEGYDHFEITKVPPKVDVCDRRYVFNQYPLNDQDFRAASACPPSSQPETLVSAFQSHRKSYQAAFATATVQGAKSQPKPSIAGLKEAKIVAEWSRKRARGERVTMEPPVMGANGEVIQTTSRMGRLKSAIEAEEKARARSGSTQPQAAQPAAVTTAPPPAKPRVDATSTGSTPDTPQTEAAPTAPAGSKPKKLWGLLGG
ncbi:MAG: hypothetical protein K5872_15460 [Rhizobiaceae bacterium]|nr:hypothetical protein [Rhizobiaceae bacterium]MCV0407620.1 hypothetical protein [Rhizobiaceae bacterium]